jgi:arylsulfatase A-like enzyme
MKGMLYEGGIRVPMIARWPGVVDPGSVCDKPVIGVDFYPTFMDIAGARAGEQILDGSSLVPLLNGEAREWSRTDIFWFMPGYLPGRQTPAAAVRSGDYKLIESFENETVELFNLAQDIGEREDLASAEPERAQSLRARLTRWRESTGARTPPRNPNFNPR